MKNRRGQNLCDAGQFYLDEDEDTGKRFWRGAGASDKDESRFNVGESLIMNPDTFEVGTLVKIYEPDISP